MKDSITAAGFVLEAVPSGEYDKRLVILTKELGKITAFARGARRANSSLLAAANPFTCGEFVLIEGKTAYSLIKVNNAEYFNEIAAMDPGVYYGYYFLELAKAYGQENLFGGVIVNLIYVALRALIKNVIPVKLIKAIYECRIMMINGDFYWNENDGMSEAAAYAFRVVSDCKVTSLFSFNLSRAVFIEFEERIEMRIYQIFGGRFKTLKVLRAVDAVNVD